MKNALISLNKGIKLGLVAFVLMSVISVPNIANADFCTELSGDFSGFLDCADQFSSFTDFEGGLEAPSTEGYDDSLTQATDARTFVKNITNFVLGFLGFIAILVIIYSGFLYVTSRGEEEATKKGKDGIKFAVIGIVIILSSFAIVNTVLQAPSGDSTNIQTGNVRGSAGGRSMDNSTQLANFNTASEEVKDITREFVRTYEQFQSRNLMLRTLTSYVPNKFTTRADFVNYLEYVKGELRRIQRNVGPVSYAAVNIEAIISQVINPGIQAVGVRVQIEEQEFIQDTAFENDFKDFFEGIARGASEWGNGLFGNTSSIQRNFNCSLPVAERSVEFDYSNCSEARQQENNSKLGTEIDAEFDKKIVEYVLVNGLNKDYDRALEQYALRIENIQESLTNNTSSQANALAQELQTLFDAVQAGFDGEVNAANVALDFGANQANPFLDNATPTANYEGIDIVKEFIEDLQKLYTALKRLKFTVPVITANIVRGSAPLIVTFDGSESYDPTNKSIEDGQYEWDPEGDGDFASNNATKEVVECTTNDFKKASITCIYKKPGSYVVGLRVKSNKEATDIQPGLTYLPIRVTPPTAKIDLRVKPTADSDYIILRQYDADGNLALDINQFTVTLNESSKNDIEFDASGTTGNKIVNYNWYFSDAGAQITGSGANIETSAGETSAVENAKKIKRKFSKRGVYDAFLSVTDEQGNMDRKLFKVIVSSIVSRINIVTSPGVPGEEFVFDGSNSRTDGGSITSYQWSVSGDETPENNDKETFRYTFDEPGSYTVSLKVTDAAGNTNTTDTEVKIESQAPRALFRIEFPEPNNPGLVILDAEETFDPDPGDNDSLKYYWRIFNAAENTDYIIQSGALTGNKEQASKLTLKFKKKGTYKVELKVEDSHEGNLMKTGVNARDVLIRNIVDIAFGEDQKYASQLSITDAGTLNAEATFNLVSENADLAEVNFGDGNKQIVRFVGGQATVTHKYTRAGAFELSIRASKGNDFNTLKTTYIVGGGNEPIAIPTVQIGNSTYTNVSELPVIYKNTTVVFNASNSLNSIGATGSLANLNYSWNFGDGNSSTQSIVSHTYRDVAPRDPGFFRVTLTVTDKLDATKTNVRTFNLKVQPAKPTLQTIVATPLNGQIVTPINVKVEAVAPTDRDGRIVQYRFYYYPIGKENEELGVKITDVPTTILGVGVFGQQGEKVEYGFCVDMKDDEGNEVKCRELFEEGSPAKIMTTNGKNINPTASFRVDKTSIKVGETITFQDSSRDPDGKIVEWVYDLDGDNSFTNDQVYEQAQVSHTYTKKSPKEGFKVRLRIKDDKGAYATSSPVTIFVEGKLDPPEPAFTYVAPDLNVLFKDNSKSDEDNNGSIIKREWDFNTLDDSDGNGDPTDDVDSTATNPTFRYPRSGIYNVKLTVTDSEDSEASITRQVTVQAIPAGAANPFATTNVVPSSAPESINSGTVVTVPNAGSGSSSTSTSTGNNSSNQNNSTQNAGSQVTPFRDLFRSIPAVDTKTDTITIQGTSGEVTFTFDHLPANTAKIIIDKNIYFDTNGGKIGTPGDGIRNNDIDFESTTRNPYRTTYNSSFGATRSQIAVIDKDGNVYTDQVDIVFTGNNLGASLIFDPTDNLPAFTYFILLALIIIFGGYAIKHDSKPKSKKKLI